MHAQLARTVLQILYSYGKTMHADGNWCGVQHLLSQVLSEQPPIWNVNTCSVLCHLHCLCQSFPYATPGCGSQHTMVLKLVVLIHAGTLDAAVLPTLPSAYNMVINNCRCVTELLTTGIKNRKEDWLFCFVSRARHW